MRRSVITHRRSWEWGSSASHWTLSYTRARVGFLNIVFTEHAFSSIHKTKIVCPFANSAIWKSLHNYFQLEKYTRKRKETQTSAALLHQSPYKNIVIFSSFFFFCISLISWASVLCVFCLCAALGGRRASLPQDVPTLHWHRAGGAGWKPRHRFSLRVRRSFTASLILCCCWAAVAWSNWPVQQASTVGGTIMTSIAMSGYRIIVVCLTSRHVTRFVCLKKINISTLA